jgi:hypothetical protein
MKKLTGRRPSSPVKPALKLRALLPALFGVLAAVASPSPASARPFAELSSEWRGVLLTEQLRPLTGTLYSVDGRWFAGRLSLEGSRPEKAIVYGSIDRHHRVRMTLRRPGRTTRHLLGVYDPTREEVRASCAGTWLHLIRRPVDGRLTVRCGVWEREHAFDRECTIVQWERPASLAAKDVLGYVVYRVDSTGGFAIAGAVDGDRRHSFIDDRFGRTVVGYDGAPGDGSPGRRRTLGEANGVELGETYRYMVATAHRHGMSLLAGGNEAVTVIGAPEIEVEVKEPSDPPRRVRVWWRQPKGADRYFIWASTDPTFEDPRQRFYFGPFHTVPVDQGGPGAAETVINFERLRERRPKSWYFITVAAYSSEAEGRPQPFGGMFGPRRPVNYPDVPPPP